jgi:L-alanine-DL-glutamate epimerase-like enolase superfamily enzyme
MQVRYWTHELKFRHPFTISKGTKTHQPTLIIELSMGSWKGYGEAPSISYYPSSAQLDMVKQLELKLPFIEKFAFTDPERFWHFLHHLFPGQPFLVAALDIAGWDLYGQLKGKSLTSLWGLTAAAGPITDFTIGIDSPVKMVQKLTERPWPLYKIKVGSADDLARLELLRTKTQSPFRVDANAGWTVEQAVAWIPKLKELGVDLIEQPLAKEDWEGMQQLKQLSSIPLFADESCVGEGDVEKCAAAFHGINIKLTKCSGITPARRMIKKARTLGLQLMLGSMNESTIGSAAVAHLRSLVDQLDMDGPLLLEEDLAHGVRYENGSIFTTDLPGLGIQYKGLIKSEH